MGAGSTETSAKMFNTFGRHVIGELYECTPSLLKDLNKISNVVKSAALNAGATIVGDFAHKYDRGNGISYILVVKESHISIHSWPEHRYASVDVYTCGQVDPWRIFNEIALFLSPKVVSAVEVRRGVMREIMNKGEEEPAIKGFKQKLPAALKHKV
jgi:S-adenosylmethionine decarboxylase